MSACPYIRVGFSSPHAFSMMSAPHSQLPTKVPCGLSLIRPGAARLASAAAGGPCDKKPCGPVRCAAPGAVCSAPAASGALAERKPCGPAWGAPGAACRASAAAGAAAQGADTTSAALLDAARAGVRAASRALRRSRACGLRSDGGWADDACGITRASRHNAAKRPASWRGCWPSPGQHPRHEVGLQKAPRALARVACGPLANLVGRGCWPSPGQRPRREVSL